MTTTTFYGLDAAGVERMRAAHGTNLLTLPAREPWWIRLLEKFDDPTIKILLAAAAVSLLITAAETVWLSEHDASFLESVGIFLAVGLATLVAFLSELKSAREFELLNKVKDDIHVKVLRDGQVGEISIGDVVVGDLVQLASGDKVPADGVVIDSMGLLVDQSVMTGESVPIEKEPYSEPGAIAPGSLDDRHLVYRGTMVDDGHGLFRVTNVGDATKLGQIAASLGGRAESESNTPLTLKLAALAKQISIIGVSGAAAIFLIMTVAAFVNSGGQFTLPLLKEILLAFIIAVTVIVVAVPEGLPMMVTVSLALNMMKMARENCLVRKLIASETIGSATVVCTDKTGTLTQNKMESVWLLFGMKEYDLHNLGVLKTLQEWESFVDSIAINTEANLHIEGKTVTEIGNPTECAMLRTLHGQGIDYNEHREKFPRIYELAHNSQRKLSMVVVEHDDKRTTFLKGAPERILSFCETGLCDENVVPLEEHREALDTVLHDAESRALRVIAFSRFMEDAAVPFDPENCFENRRDTLIGLLGIADPIRPEVAAAVATCREAGVDVKMITGDALPTAVAIAKQAGILANYHPGTDTPGSCVDELVMSSGELATVSDADLPDIARRLRVLARSTPMDKLRLVKAMHHDGEVVAMTGDGTNDAPALKFADVGLSMGVAGTEVAKEASDIVLMDDNFKSIVTGIWWGRTLYQNIQRFLQFQLSVNVVALSCALIGPMVGIPLPFTVTQLLWINIIMDTFAAIALSTDPPRRNCMQRKPIPREASIITPTMLVTILINSFYQVVILFLVLYGGWFVEDSKDFTFYADPRDPANRHNIHGLTVFFTVFVMFQFWHKFNCRSLEYGESPFAMIHKNRAFLFIIGITTLVQVFLVQASEYFPMIGTIFRTVPLNGVQWLQIMLLTATIVPVAWTARWIAAVVRKSETGGLRT